MVTVILAAEAVCSSSATWKKSH